MEIKFWQDGNKTQINPELFSTCAETWAKKICEAGLNEKQKLEKNKISQLRKFYDETLRFSGYLKGGEDYKTILPYLKMLNAKVAYAEGRKLVTGDFKIFINQSVKQLIGDNKQEYEVFTSFFEAFMGYYKFYESKYK